MAKEQFRQIRFKRESMDRILQMVAIISEYEEQGLRLTARQLYYAHVARGMIQNKITEYKRLTNLLTDARYAGLVDWDAIEDRGRVPERPSEWSDPASLMRGALAGYRLPRWAGQDAHVELWVEKQALAGVLSPLADEFHATLMVNKGYSSASAMKESADRIIHYGRGKDRAVIFYLGDHDPSGEDMVRDIEERLVEFGCDNLIVRKLALTFDQVQQYNPPPNPAKITDPRAAKYIEKYGAESWEVDALDPKTLSQLIREAFEGEIDTEMMETIKEQEEKDKELLRVDTKNVMKKRKT